MVKNDDLVHEINKKIDIVEKGLAEVCKGEDAYWELVGRRKGLESIKELIQGY